MITIFNCTKNTKELTVKQRAKLLKYIADYASTAYGSWLNDVDYSRFIYMWKKDLEESDVQAIRPFKGYKIILQPNKNNQDWWIKLIAPAAVHELRHVWQKNQKGWLIYSLLAPLGRIPGFQETAPLEKDAFDQQDRAESYINNLKELTQ